MDWYQTVFELIDMRSFSNLWYWIGLAVMWSTVSHWVLGVPFDMVQRARRQGGEAAEDLEAMVRICLSRMRYIERVAGLWVLGVGSALLATLFTLGFWYDVEVAQAIFLLGFPLAIVSMMSVAAARRIQRAGAQGDLLYRMMARHRFWTQVVGMISIFVTAVWGMYQNLSLGALGA